MSLDTGGRFLAFLVIFHVTTFGSRQPSLYWDAGGDWFRLVAPPWRTQWSIWLESRREAATVFITVLVGRLVRGCATPTRAI